MSLWLWTFWTYSFLGYLLERGYAIATHADRQARKCFLLLPMCPVYGLGPWRCWPCRIIERQLLVSGPVGRSGDSSGVYRTRSL
ncbi:MAG: putative ABC transporter permease [Dysosmobacter welbionis]